MLTTWSTPILAKGISGYYIQSGYALSKPGDTLKNQQIIEYFNDSIDTIKTNSRGYYEVKVKFSTPCPSGIMPWQRRRATRKLNPKYIFFSFNDTKIKVINEWRRFVAGGFRSSETNRKEENLVF